MFFVAGFSTEKMIIECTCIVEEIVLATLRPKLLKGKTLAVCRLLRWGRVA